MKHRLALLDMNNGVPNQGMRCIQAIAKSFADDFDSTVFDVRAKGEVPGTDFDAFICSGGPGSPLASGLPWEDEFFGLLDRLWAHNRDTSDPGRRKYVFFICHSFQLAVRYFGSGAITARRSMSFGTFPVRRSVDGDEDVLFEGLDETFYVADFREYQVLRPNHNALAARNASVLAYEKVRDHVPYERAVMAIRWSEEWVGTQFHPEADAPGMIIHFNSPDRRAVIIDEHGQDKYEQMMSDLADPTRIEKTSSVIIPNFLRRAKTKLDARLPAKVIESDLGARRAA